MKEYKKRVSIVIPTMTYSWVKDCVNSIIQYTDTSDLEIVVVANGGDTFADMFKEYDCVRVIYFDHPLGAVKAYNEGIKAAEGEYVVLMNDDCAVLESPKNFWLDELLKPFDGPVKVAVTGLFRMTPKLGMRDLNFSKEKSEYGFILFFCSVIPRVMFDKIGLLDERLECGVDVDFCMKARALGYSIVQVPEEELNQEGALALGSFPFYHQGEGTVHGFYKEEWKKILIKDAEELNQRYGVTNSKVSIVIPAYGNYLDDLRKCLDSISLYTDLIGVEVIVVANGCKPEMKEYLDTTSARVLWYDSPLGCSGAINAGLREAEGEIIIVLNHDVIITGKEWFNLLVDPFVNPKVGITGVLKLPVDNFDVDFLMFFCVAIRKKMMEQIGMLDENFIKGGCEDIDYSVRALDAGWELVSVSEQQVSDKGFTGMFPIYHMEHHSEWLTSEEYAKNVDYLFKKHTKHLTNTNREIIIPKWAVAQKKYELVMLQEFLKNYRIEKILEVGTYRGGTAMLWSHIVKPVNGRVFCADLKFDWGAFQDHGYADSENKVYRRQIYNDSEYEKYVTEIEGDTHNPEFVKRVYDTLGGKVDFIFIDGDHTYEGVKQDFENYCSCVKEGGYIAFHDICDGDYPDKVDCHVDILWKQLKDVFPSWEFFDNNEYAGCPAKSMGIGVIQYKSEFMDRYKNLKRVVRKEKVTAYISTKDRYHTTLPMAIAGIIGQTVKPAELILFDDGEQKDLRQDPVYGCLFGMMDDAGIAWNVIFGERKGQVANHQKALMEAKHGIIWRVDDDNFPEANVLEVLLNKLLSDDKIGAVASRSAVPNQKASKSIASSKIEDLYSKPNLQWAEFAGSEEADHLHNSFLFRKEAGQHGYHMGLSPVGHREETMFSYQMKLNGWKLYVIGDVITWHLRQPYGGIRHYNDGGMWEHDEKIFREWMQYRKNMNGNFIAVLDSGIGDHLEFLNVLPEMKKKYNHLILATCYPEVFKDEGVKQISIAEATNILGNIDNYNIYKFMSDRNWNKSIVDAYRGLYQL